MGSYTLQRWYLGRFWDSHYWSFVDEVRVTKGINGLRKPRIVKGICEPGAKDWIWGIGAGGGRERLDWGFWDGWEWVGIAGFIVRLWVFEEGW